MRDKRFTPYMRRKNSVNKSARKDIHKLFTAYQLGCDHPVTDLCTALRRTAEAYVTPAACKVYVTHLADCTWLIFRLALTHALAGHTAKITYPLGASRAEKCIYGAAIIRAQKIAQQLQGLAKNVASKPPPHTIPAP